MKNDINKTINVSFSEAANIVNCTGCLNSLPMTGNATYRLTRTINRLNSATNAVRKKNTALIEKYGVSGEHGNKFIPQEGTPKFSEATPEQQEGFRKYFIESADLIEDELEVDIFPIRWDQVFSEENMVTVNKTQLATLLENGLIIDSEE